MSILPRRAFFARSSQILAASAAAIGLASDHKTDASTVEPTPDPADSPGSERENRRWPQAIKTDNTTERCGIIGRFDSPYWLKSRRLCISLGYAGEGVGAIVTLALVRPCWLARQPRQLVEDPTIVARRLGPVVAIIHVSTRVGGK